MKTVKIIVYVVSCNAVAFAGAWGMIKLEILPEYEKEFFGAMAVIILCGYFYHFRKQNKNSRIKIKFLPLKLKQVKK